MVLKIIEHKVFESFIIVCIIASSILLAFDDVYLKIDSQTNAILEGFDYFFQAIFFFEMIFKWIGLGLKKYFTDWWCLLDFVVVLVILKKTLILHHFNFIFIFSRFQLLIWDYY
jgi:hypothetical protein